MRIEMTPDQAVIVVQCLDRWLVNAREATGNNEDRGEIESIAALWGEIGDALRAWEAWKKDEKPELNQDVVAAVSQFAREEVFRTFALNVSGGLLTAAQLHRAPEFERNKLTEMHVKNIKDDFAAADRACEILDDICDDLSLD
jgi:hypothetical protein